MGWEGKEGGREWGEEETIEMIPSEQIIMGLSAYHSEHPPMMLLFRNKPPDSSLAHNQSKAQQHHVGPCQLYHKQTDNCDCFSFIQVGIHKNQEHTHKEVGSFRADVKSSCDKSLVRLVKTLMQFENCSSSSADLAGLV